MTRLGGDDPKFDQKVYEKINEIAKNVPEGELISGFYVNSKFLLPEDRNRFDRLGVSYAKMEEMYWYGYPIYAVKDFNEDIMVEYVDLVYPPNSNKEEHVKQKAQDHRKREGN